MSRWHASGIHLLISAAVVITVTATMLFIWYPSPLFQAAGGQNILFILAAVDITIGPLITLIIFDVEKKGLKFDLSVIATLQIVALLYGAHVVYQARPVYLLFIKDRFELMTANQIEPQQLAKVTRPEFRHLPFGRYRLAAAEMPTGHEGQLILFASALKQIDVQYFPQYYVPYDSQVNQIINRGIPLSQLTKKYPRAVESVSDFLRSSGRKENELLFLPLYAKKKDVAVLVDAKTAAIVQMLAVDNLI